MVELDHGTQQREGKGREELPRSAFLVSQVYYKGGLLKRVAAWPYKKGRLPPRLYKVCQGAAHCPSSTKKLPVPENLHQIRPFTWRLHAQKPRISLASVWICTFLPRCCLSRLCPLCWLVPLCLLGTQKPAANCAHLSTIPWSLAGASLAAASGSPGLSFTPCLAGLIQDYLPCCKYRIESHGWIQYDQCAPNIWNACDLVLR